MLLYLPLADIEEIEIDSNLNVRSCREKLMRVYKTKTCRIQIKPWDRASVEDVKDVYTVVTMYKKDSQGKNLGERENIILEGSVDDIFTTKVNGMLPHRIVIIAPAGKGKSTAVAKMAYDWAYGMQGSTFVKLPLLFILRLREVNEDTSLGQAIVEQLLPDVDESRPKALETFIKNNQKLCWIVFDGLDEFKGSIKERKKVASNIVNIITNKDLPDCRVLVTTRPHLENDFDQGDLPRVYAKMLIEGFSHQNSRQYIERFFISNSNKGSELNQYLEQNDVINELVSTPLFCLMVCYLWREELISDMDTQSKLFDSITKFLLHHSKARSISNKYTEEWLSNVLLNLGKVALEGLKSNSNKLIFTPDDFKKFPKLIEEGCELGIISKTENFPIPKTSVKQCTKQTFIEFYHKLAQEHVAGKYLARENSKLQMVLKITKLDRLMRANKEHIGNYEHLLRFAAGTSPQICNRVMSSIMSNTSLEESERFRLAYDCSCESPGLEGAVSSMIRGCILRQSVVLKSPTIYTVVGIKKLPEQFKKEVRITAKSRNSIPLTEKIDAVKWRREITSKAFMCVLKRSKISICVCRNVIM